MLETKDVYKHIKIFWDSIFKNESQESIAFKDFENEALKKATDFLCENTESVLDFGCGNGSWLFKCYMRGTKKHIGIDLSKQGIAIAKKRKDEILNAEVTNDQISNGKDSNGQISNAQVSNAQVSNVKVSKKRGSNSKVSKTSFKFHQGGIPRLEKVKDGSVDAIILSNILDNLLPEDANQLIYQAHRILKEDGKILIKLNPYITQEQIREWNIGVIEGNLLDDGLYLWNQTTEEWRDLFSHYFEEVFYEEVYFEEHEQYNRLFCMVKSK